MAAILCRRHTTSSMPWHEAGTRPEGAFYHQCYLKSGSDLTMPVLQWGLEEILGMQMSLWSNGRWAKQGRDILQGHSEGGQALQRLMKGHQLWLHMGQVIRVTPKGRNCCKDNNSGTAFPLQKQGRLYPWAWETSPWHYWQNSLLIPKGQDQACRHRRKQLSGENPVLSW